MSFSRSLSAGLKVILLGDNWSHLSMCSRANQMMVKKEEQSPSQCRETMVDSQSTEANSELEQENAASGQNQGGPKPTTLDVSRANEQGGGEELHGANDAGNSQGTGPTEEDSDSSSLPDQVEARWRSFIDLGTHRPMVN